MSFLNIFLINSISILDFSLKGNLSCHSLSMHNSNKGWICDCCGSRFGIKNALKIHMMTHLPPLFCCSECDRKFVYVCNLNTHKKLHRGILNEICKFCNKGFPTKDSLSGHIITKHFVKLVCEVDGCSSTFSTKGYYKRHLKSVHKKNDQVLIGKLLEKVEKLKPNHQQLKYV